MRQGDFWERIPLSVGLQAEPLPGRPLIELIGDRRILIENHRGVTVYSCHEICIRVSFGILRVCGNGLQLAQMTSQQLIIIGCIDSLSLIRG